MSDAVALKPGFSDPVFHGQAVFRRILDALSRPGRIETLDVEFNPASLVGFGVAMTGQFV